MLRFALRTGAVCLFAACGLLPGSAGARNGHWQPPGIVPSTEPLATVLELYAKASGTPDRDYAQRTEEYALVAGGERVTSIRTVRYADFRVRTAIDGGDFESGRDRGLRWRRTPNGLTRIISADIQGDDLDRWPLGNLPFDANDCTLAGEAHLAKPAWVVEYHPERDLVHWFYIDEASGDLVREEWRDGAVVAILDFDDIRNDKAGRRAYHWVTGGNGEREEVTLLSVATATVPESEVAMPASNATMFDAAPPGATKLQATFLNRGATIVTPGSLNGQKLSYLVDSGTSQILVDGGTANRAGVHTFLGHGIAQQLSLGSIQLHDVAIQTTGLPADLYHSEAIAGYELFSNRVVHIDYRHGEVSVLDRVPDETTHRATRLDTTCDAGMPIVHATVENASGPNFALDTGSSAVVVFRYLWERDGADEAAVPVKNGATGVEHYLEGPLPITRMVGEVTLAGVRITGATIEVERASSGDRIEPPIDGVIGANVLGAFEWWFDCAHHAVWFAPYD